MDTGIKEMIKNLESELGYTEKGGGYTKFGDWYSKNVDHSYDFSNAAWCDMFLVWGATKAGVAKQVGKFAYTPSHAAFFKKHKAFDAKPAPGALVFYDWSGGKGIDGIDHVGIVTEVDGGRIHTIEGNVDGQFVKRKVRDQDNVVGYGHPVKVPIGRKPAAAPAQHGGDASGSGAKTAAMAYTRPAPADGPSVEPWSAVGAVLFLTLSLLVFLKRRRATTEPAPAAPAPSGPRTREEDR
ncbi:CHAP domain-containing protein [Actinomadura nitritigenes]|uniref:CHAP domain-containing protein n=1 Tax=Actinomadura nitritigenes TaxID=134602 RepID=UPI003D94335B